MDAVLATHPMISIRDDASVREAAGLMADSRIGAVGVIDEAKSFCGIFTERDLLSLVALGRDLNSIRLRDVANEFPVIVEGPISMNQAAERMRRSRIRHLVVKEDGEYNIISIRDLNVPIDLMTLTARDVMTSPGVVCRQDAYLAEVAEILADRDISGLPVVDEEGSLTGMVSERDLAHALGSPLVRLAVRRPSPHRGAKRAGPAVRAADIMTTPLITVEPSTPISELSRSMIGNDINRLPVVDDGRLVGVVSRGDVLRALAGISHARVTDPIPDVVVLGGSGLLGDPRPDSLSSAAR